MSKLAIIGFGKIAVKHLEVFRALGVDIVASANRSESGRDFAKENGIPVTYSNFNEMIEKEKPDMLLNCVSFETIFEVTKQLIPHGIPTLIEKPAGTSLGELDELIALQKEHGTKIMVALNRRHYSIFHKAIQHAGGSENITSIDIEWSETPKRLLDEKGYSEESVAKIIFGNSIHGIDMMTYYGKGIQDYSINTVNRGRRFRWLMDVTGKSGEKLLSFQNSWDNPVPWRMVFTAEDKRYVFAPLETCSVTELGKENLAIVPDEVDQKYKPGFYKQAQTFLSGEFDDFGLESCRSSMKIAEEFYNQLYK